MKRAAHPQESAPIPMEPAIAELYTRVIWAQEFTAKLAISTTKVEDGRRLFKPPSENDPRIHAFRKNHLWRLIDRLMKLGLDRLSDEERQIEFTAEQTIAILDWAEMDRFELNQDWLAATIHSTFRLYRHSMPDDFSGPLPPAEAVVGQKAAIHHMEALRRRILKLKAERAETSEHGSETRPHNGDASPSRASPPHKSAKEAADDFGVKVTTIYRMCRNNKIPGVRFDEAENRWIIPTDARRPVVKRNRKPKAKLKTAVEWECPRCSRLTTSKSVPKCSNPPCNRASMMRKSVR